MECWLDGDCLRYLIKLLLYDYHVGCYMYGLIWDYVLLDKRLGKYKFLFVCCTSIDIGEHMVIPPIKVAISN